jgi:hypothetical protein
MPQRDSRGLKPQGGGQPIDVTAGREPSEDSLTGPKRHAEEHGSMVERRVEAGSALACFDHLSLSNNPFTNCLCIAATTMTGGSSARMTVAITR